ncbi:MAG: dTDP-4-dehydrorhamnose reductase [Bacteroidales bacterium]|nr:dTDP-4-dehydrorhamnose reductase [Bacteroidales bacterium]
MDYTILITGSDGQLGNELNDLQENLPGTRFIFTDIDTLDITDFDKLTSVTYKENPRYIINCAGYTAVDNAETDEDKANLINGTAVSNIVKAISKTNCRLIHISTDFVFDGNSKIPYTEIDIPSPVSKYGQSKLMGEEEALKHTNSIVIRTSWLYSSFGSNFVKTILKLAGKTDTLNIIDDQTGTPTYAKDLAAAIIEIIRKTESGEKKFIPGIYHFSNRGEATWYQFAKEIINIKKLDTKILPIPTSGYPLPAERPVYSVMSKDKILNIYNLTIPHWKESLVLCLDKISENHG